MLLKKFLLYISIISCRRIARRDSNGSARDSLIALGSMKHGHAVLDEAFFYDFLSLSIEFNKQNLDAYVQVNIDPNFPGFTKSQFNTLLEKWIYAMLATGYWSIMTTATMKLGTSLRYCSRHHRRPKSSDDFESETLSLFTVSLRCNKSLLT